MERDPIAKTESREREDVRNSKRKEGPVLVVVRAPWARGEEDERAPCRRTAHAFADIPDARKVLFPLSRSLPLSSVLNRDTLNLITRSLVPPPNKQTRVSSP